MFAPNSALQDLLSVLVEKKKKRVEEGKNGLLSYLQVHVFIMTV